MEGVEEVDEELLKKLGETQLAKADDTLLRIQALLQGKRIAGLRKLGKRIKAERDFLQTLLSGGIIKRSHVECSNLGHLMAVCAVVEGEKDVIAVQRTFTVDGKEGGRFEVDVVCRGGAMWIKVKAMKAATIRNLFYGNGSFGTKSISHTAKQMVACASQHPHNFQPPIVAFWFSKGVTADVAYSLQSLGITVHGDLAEDPTPETSEEEGEEAAVQSRPTITEKLNSLIAEEAPNYSSLIPGEETEIPEV